MKIYVPDSADGSPPSEPWTRRTLLADLTGLSTLALSLGLMSRLELLHEVPFGGWIAIYGLLAITMFGLWHVDKPALTGSRSCLQAAAASIVVGGLFFAVDAVNGHFNHPELPLLKVATTVGSPFGFVLTLLVFPGTFLTSVASYFRFRALGR